MGRSLALLALLGAACAPVKTPEVTLENWDDGGELSHRAFLSIPEIFPTAVISRGAATPLPLEADLDESIGRHEVTLADGTRMAFDDYVAAGALDGIVILRGGTIVYESYPRMRPNDRHILFSVSKVLVSTVIAVLEDRGLVDVSMPVETYLPTLRGTAWEGIPVVDILDMTSGIDALEDNESYTNPETNHYRYEASLGWLPLVDGLPPEVVEQDTYSFIASLPRKSAPGELREYVSVNTMVLAWLAEEVTGQKFPEVLSETIWSKMGAEDDALVTVNARAVSAVHGGVVATLRDVARFGLLFTKGRGRGVVSGDYIIKILEGSRPTYQWDRVFRDGPEGSFYKGGFGGQGLYVSPGEDLVLAYFGTHGFDAPAPNVLDVCRGLFAELAAKARS